MGQHIPLDELPDRLDALDLTKTIVTMCPHYDWAEIARFYLTLRGYTSRYFTGGMLKLPSTPPKCCWPALPPASSKGPSGWLRC